MHHRHRIRTIVLNVFSLALGLSGASSLHAQIDQARADPYGEFIRYYNETVKYAEDEKLAAAMNSTLLMAKALTTIYEKTGALPDQLEKGNLEDLAEQAEEFLESIQEFRNCATRFLEKIKITGQSYSSELSAMEDAYDELKEKFNLVYGNIELAARALKAACPSCGN